MLIAAAGLLLGGCNDKEEIYKPQQAELSQWPGAAEYVFNCMLAAGYRRNDFEACYGNPTILNVLSKWWGSEHKRGRGAYATPTPFAVPRLGATGTALHLRNTSWLSRNSAARIVP